MDLLENVTALLQRASQPYQAGRYVVVPTLLSYPSGKAVQAYVEGGNNSFVVADGGAAAMNFVSLGGNGIAAQKLLKSSAASFGLRVNTEGWLHSGQVPAAHLPSFIAMVAEGSLHADEAMRRHARRQNESRDFKEEVNGELRRDQPRPVVRRKHLLGASNKQHVFDFSVDLGGRTLVVDAVVPDANSINSAVVSHLDVRQAQNPSVLQLIVYNDRADWRKSDLALLGVGAPAIPFSSLRRQVEKLAA